MRNLIIGFVGYKESGKTTACKMLAKHLSNVVFHNFKDGLVAEMKENLPDVLNSLSTQYNMSIDDLFVVKPPIMRALMQNYGTEVRRGDDTEYWVNKWVAGLNELDDIVLVDDVRFFNEAEAIKDRGGILIHLYRGDLVNNKDKHISEVEQEMIKCDYQIVTCLDEVAKLESKLLGVVNDLKLV